MGEREINFEMLWHVFLKEMGFKVGCEESIELQKLAMGSGKSDSPGRRKTTGMKMNCIRLFLTYADCRALTRWSHFLLT